MQEQLQTWSRAKNGILTAEKPQFLILPSPELNKIFILFNYIWISYGLFPDGLV